MFPVNIWSTNFIRRGHFNAAPTSRTEKLLQSLLLIKTAGTDNRCSHESKRNVSHQRVFEYLQNSGRDSEDLRGEMFVKKIPSNDLWIDPTAFSIWRNTIQLKGEDSYVFPFSRGQQKLRFKWILRSFHFFSASTLILFVRLLQYLSGVKCFS